MVERLSYVSHDSSISRDPHLLTAFPPLLYSMSHPAMRPMAIKIRRFPLAPFSAHTSAPLRFLAHPQPNSKGEDFAGEVVFFWVRAYTILIQMVAIVI